MTISRDLYLSILSMDAYNRGYAPGIVGLGGLEAGIGNASISNQSDINGGTPGVNAGFYAIAYDDPTYGTIISYRGTDDYNFLSELMTVDLPLSYAGSCQQKQVALAQRFFDAVNSSNGSSPILLTGHSSGGAPGAGVADASAYSRISGTTSRASLSSDSCHPR